MKEKDNNILNGDYKEIIIETDEENPITITTIKNDMLIVSNGYRVRLIPRQSNL